MTQVNTLPSMFTVWNVHIPVHCFEQGAGKGHPSIPAETNDADVISGPALTYDTTLQCLGKAAARYATHL